MSSIPDFRITRLALHNFRCFSDCTIALDDRITVLVAENGRGKTALLDAVGIALGMFVDTIAGTRQLRGFHRSDIRLVQGADGAMVPALPTTFCADGWVGGKAIHWSRALASDKLRARTSTKDAATLHAAAEALREAYENRESEAQGIPITLPLVACYGTGRLWSEHQPTEAKNTDGASVVGRMSGYANCLSSSSSFKDTLVWYENRMREARDPRFATELSKNLALIAAVQEATRAVLEPTGWSVLEWNFERNSLLVRHRDHGCLPLSALSDGVRNMIALVVDIARRCASLNPHLGDEAARSTPGVLLIDEVDMHLHPRWQQSIIALLRSAFPALQMILSTHSPHVLSTVDNASIRVIRIVDGAAAIETPVVQTRGVESADVLWSIMGVDPVPQVEEAHWLSAYRAKIEDGEARTEDGELLRAKLLAHFGANHPVMLDCARLLRFQSFKRAHLRVEEG